MLTAWGVQLRGYGEAVRLQNQRNKSLFLARYGVENPFQIPDVIRKIQETRDSIDSHQKASKTMMERYGVDNPFRLDSVKARIKEVVSTDEFKAKKARRMKEFLARTGEDFWRAKAAKTERTNLVRYGVKNPFQIPAVREFIAKDEAGRAKRRVTMVKIGIWKSEQEKSDFDRYFCAVRSLTRKNRKALFSQWDGTCYYTGVRLVTNDEFFKGNPSLHSSRNPLRPTIDHKTSVMAGFKAGISPEVVGGIDNLCICSQRENSRKNYRTLIQYTGERYV
jgi:hypothetical protein